MRKNRMYQIECRRAFHSKGFWIALAIGCLMTLLDSYDHFQNVRMGLAYEAAHPRNWYNFSSAYNQWFATSDVWTYLVYYLIFPILAVLPYGVSYFQDRKSGYLKNVFQRVDKKSYFYAKYWAVFLSGGFVVTFPLLLNFFLVTLYMPLRPVDVLSGISAGPGTAFVRLCYSNSFLYTMVYAFILPFLTGGLFATLSLVMARMVDYYFTVLLTPFVFSILLYNLALPLGLVGITPFTFLREQMNYNPLVTFFFLFVLFLVGWFGFVRKGEKDEVF